MKWSNKFNIHPAYVHAITNDPYDKGLADFSITTLVSPPQVSFLLKKHDSEVEIDVNDRMAAFFGQMAHQVLEKYPTTGIKEERFYMVIDGSRISGKIDLYENGLITDFKTATIYKFRTGVPLEYEAQLNCYASLLRANGIDVKALECAPLYKDWAKTKVGTKSMPDSQSQRVAVELWEPSRAMAYLTERVALHKASTPIDCKPEELWGGKRCQLYCEVSRFCPQFAKVKKEEK